MGSKTFDTIGRALPGRRMFVYTSEADKYEGMGIETTDVSPDELAMNLETEGVKGLAVVVALQCMISFYIAALLMSYT